MMNIKTVYGPYKRKDDRYHVVIVFEDGTRTTKSYPKFIMEQKLGRELESWETVDHIDGDKTNNDTNNFQILSGKANKLKSSLIREDIKTNCPVCLVEFALKPSQLKSRAMKRSGPFCSKICSGKYGAEIQNGRANYIENSVKGKKILYKNKEGRQTERLL